MTISDSDHQRVLSTLYSDHHGWLNRWLRRRLRSAWDAADLTHDTYERIIVSRRVPDERQSRSWLTQIAKGLVIDLQRRRRVEASYREALAVLPAQEVPANEKRAIVFETLLEIDAALDRMNPKARRAFLLARLEHLTYPEIAQRLQVSVSAVQKYMVAAITACYATVYESDGRS